MRTKTKSSPLTPAERQKLFRQKNARVDVSKEMMSQLEDLRQHFAKELRDPKLSMKVVLGRLIHEGHYRYCSNQNRVTVNEQATENDSNAGAKTCVSGNDFPTAPGSGDHQSASGAIITVSAEAQPVTVNAQAAQEATASILTASTQTPIKFEDGRLWRQDDLVLMVRLTSRIQRKEFLKVKLGFSYGAVQEKCWNKACDSQEHMVELATTVLAFMNAAPEEQNRILNG
jgi:hypothetical protein